VNANVHRQLNRRKRRILRRIENKPGVERHQPMMAASNIHYEISERTRAIAPGGIEGTAQIGVEISFKGRRLAANHSQSACFIGFEVRRGRLEKRTSS
jgi:hypothetical protein